MIWALLSYAYLPSVYLLLLNVCSGALLIFKSGCSFSDCWIKSSLYTLDSSPLSYISIANSFSQSVACILILFSTVFCRANVFTLCSPAYQLFLLYIMPLRLYLKSHWQIQSYLPRFCPLLYFSSFIVLHFTFRPMNHFELISVKNVRSVWRFFFCMWMSSSSWTICKRLSLLHCGNFSFFISINIFSWIKFCVDLLLGSLFCFTICLFSCQYHTVLTTVALMKWVLKLSSVSPTILFFFNIVLDILDLLPFHIHFSFSLSIVENNLLWFWLGFSSIQLLSCV